MIDIPSLVLQGFSGTLPEQRNLPHWTDDEITDRLAEAAQTLRRLPWERSARPQAYGGSWPDVVHDWLAYGWVSARAGRIPPTPWEITRMDEALGWLHLLSREQRLLCWARAQHWSWKKIEALDELERCGKGRGARQLRSIMRDGIGRIVSHLNGTPRRMVVTHEPLRQAR